MAQYTQRAFRPTGKFTLRDLVSLNLNCLDITTQFLNILCECRGRNYSVVANKPWKAVQPVAAQACR